MAAICQKFSLRQHGGYCWNCCGNISILDGEIEAMTPTRELLEAALQGYDIQRKAIEAKQAEIREALKSPVDVMAQVSAMTGPEGVTGNLFRVTEPAGESFLSRLEKQTRDPFKPKRKMSAAGRAAISKATKARWSKYRKAHNGK